MSVPVPQTIQVTSTTTGTSAPFTASFVPSTGGNFVTVTPSSGNTPATLTLSVNAAVSSMLAAGTYTGTVQVASGSGAVQTVNVTLLVSAAGSPVVLAITSGASLQPGAVSPGEIVTIFGNGIGPATPATGTSFEPTTSGTVPTTLANVTVTFNNVPAPLIFVSQGQINAIVPYEVAGQTSVPVVVNDNGTKSATFTVPVLAVTPSIFSLADNGSGQGAILNSDASVNGTSNPAAPGSIISIYATGEGQTLSGRHDGLHHRRNVCHFPSRWRLCRSLSAANPPPQLPMREKRRTQSAACSKSTRLFRPSFTCRGAACGSAPCLRHKHQFQPSNYCGGKVTRWFR